MLLELKKDERRKGRLVGQGFWETESQYGKKIDSPVASLAAVRMLSFMGEEVEDEVMTCTMVMEGRAVAMGIGRSCRRGRAWSSYRNRCVRVYSRG